MNKNESMKMNKYKNKDKNMNKDRNVNKDKDKKPLPQAVLDYIDASNNHDVEAYLNAFSESAVIEEASIGRDLRGKSEIRDYFVSYFIKYETQTEILDYSIEQNTVDMHVWFKGVFPGNEIGGFYRFVLEDGKIAKLLADLE